MHRVIATLTGRRIFLAPFAVLLAAPSLPACRTPPSQAEPIGQTSPAPAPTPATALPDGDGTSSPGGSSFELSGVAQPFRTSRLSTKAGGILHSIKTREGARVSTGQILCLLDKTDLQIHADGAAVAEAQAAVALKTAESDLARAKNMFQGGSFTDQGLEKAELGWRMAKLQLDAARVAVRAAQQALADATLRAPFSGVITKVLAEEGQMITTMPPTVLFVLADTDTLEVRIPVPERKLDDMRVGLPVKIIFPAAGVERDGKIDRLPAVVDPTTRSVEAIVRIDNRDQSLPAGLYARVRFPTLDGEGEPAPAKAGSQE